ncbi:MAG: MoxR family ATPase, partial [Chloroflexi bacterium]|nr:MoxR family ATPase [Chloroflexota bacterium]
LADEINRSSSRTQSALLEAMGESQVTIDGTTYPLPKPFWVVATQNEADPYGTFPLPYAELDRFLMSLRIGYPDMAEQVAILDRNQHREPETSPVLTLDEVLEVQSMVKEVEVARPIKEYIARIILAIRRHVDTGLGGSPRSGVQLQRAAQAHAALSGRTYTTPEDVKAVAVAVLGHRLVTSPSSNFSSPAALVQGVLGEVPVPG